MKKKSGVGGGRGEREGRGGGGRRGATNAYIQSDHHDVK
jgi:hypothetical protein